MKLNPAMSILKKITNTSPALYLVPEFKEAGQLAVSSTQLDPYQNPSAYDQSINPNRDPRPIPMKIPYFVEFLVTLTKVLEYY